MKIRNFLDPYKILTENMLVNEWTFGFELEAICANGELNYGDLPGYHVNEEPKGKVLDLKLELDRLFGASGKIERDGSVHPSSSKGGWAFEYPSGIFKFNIEEIKRITKILYEDLPKLNVYTNRSCGFHTHFSNNSLDKKDTIWLMCCMALDDNLRKELQELNSKADERETEIVKKLINDIKHTNETGELTFPELDYETNVKKNAGFVSALKRHPKFGDIKVFYKDNGKYISRISLESDKDTYDRELDKDYYDINYDANGEIESIESGINLFQSTYANMGFFNQIRELLVRNELLHNGYYYFGGGHYKYEDDLPQSDRIGKVYSIDTTGKRFMWTGVKWKDVTDKLNNEYRTELIQLYEDPLEQVKRYFDNSEKYRIMNTHSGGTLEWRGPRNFLSTGNKDVIFNYFKKCYRLLTKLSSLIDKRKFTTKINPSDVESFNEINDSKWNGEITLDRDEIEKYVDSSFKFNSAFEKSKVRKDNPSQGLEDAVKNDTKKLLKLKYEQLKVLIQKDGFIDKINEKDPTILVQLWNKLDVRTIKALADDSLYDVRQWIVKMGNTDQLFIIPEEIAKEYENNDEQIFANIFLPHINYIPLKYIKKNYQQYSNDIDNKIRDFLVTNNKHITMEDWNVFLNDQRYWDLLYYLKMPVKIQMKMVRKNPYFIQYIKNPDQSVINYAKKKVDNIEQFISRM